MMSYIKNVLIEYKSFFYLYLLFLVAGGVALLVYSKEESFFLINGNYASWADSFFKGVTQLGDGLFFVLVTLALAVYKYRLSIIGLVIFLISSLLAQSLKHTLFRSFLRPFGVFGTDERMHVINGITLHTGNSFPSGHTTTAFALALFLTMAFNSRRNGWLYAIVAMLVGYSRVYLGQHFPVDVYFGSILGVLSCLLIYAWLDEPLKRKFGDKGLLSKK